MPVFDIPTHRLVDLTDADLRELIARLCEAEREKQGGHRNEVRWGGSQTAADGGLDVVVEPVGPFVAAGPLSRKNVGIQVKVADLAAAEITDEMRPKDLLRLAISGLAASKGAYLIASAGSNCSEEMLRRRITAMRAAVADDPNGSDLNLGFLDRNAIGRWVSAHPSVAAWVRKPLTLPILEGWQPFCRWSSTPDGESDDLICEQGLVFHIESKEPIRSLPDALGEIRKLVRSGKGSVRIAGLSGIGKTRIAQALFEPAGDVTPLATSHAIYTDLGHSPDPAPLSMLEALIERNAPAILVVDNCPPDTHQVLARRLAERPGPVSIITIEYDVRADRPEETDVIRVEAEGPNIVEALLRRRHGNMSAADAQRLAELAQGNARLAFALAQAAPDTGTLSAFNDSALFDRLFWQRETPDIELTRAAEVLSLVYSFEVEGLEEHDELAFLGSLAEISRGAMHRHAVALLDRGLAQARSKWRAVLPHALANRLARQAIRSTSWRTIADSFSDKPRLRRSLARRLSYLHDCKEARFIVTRWMEMGGPLHGPTPNMQILEAVCHLAPEETLQIIDNITPTLLGTHREFSQYDSLIRIISRIAYSEKMFPQACQSLTALVATLDKQRASTAENALSNLFGLYLSGTQARTETRIRVARQYLLANAPNQNALGISMLRSALRTGHWSFMQPLYDDARPHAFGWEPNAQEIQKWFASWIDLTTEIPTHALPEINYTARKILAYEIGEIWLRVPGIRPHVEEVARTLHTAAPWLEGRHALKQMLYSSHRRGEQLAPADTERVRQLINYMEPFDLESRVRSELVKGWDFDLYNEKEERADAEARRNQRLVNYGQELATQHDVLRTVGRELLEADGYPFFQLGAGLAQGAENPADEWAILRDLHLSAPAKTRQRSLFAGFVQKLDEIHPAIAAEIREECRATAALRKDYDVFLPYGVLSAQELENVIEIAAEPETQAGRISEVAWREKFGLNDEDRVRLLRAILTNSGGAEIVVDALRMLRRVDKDALDHWPEALRQLGLDATVGIINAGDLNPTTDARIARILPTCLHEDDGSGANRVMNAVMDYSARRYGSAFGTERVLAVLARCSTEIFLSRVFPDDPEKPGIQLRNAPGPGPIAHAPVGSLIEWCRKNPDRWSRVARQFSPFSDGNDDDGEIGLISPMAAEFLEAAPHPEEVAAAYLTNLGPFVSSGNRAEIMERRLAAIECLIDDRAPEAGRKIAHLASDTRVRIEQLRRAQQEAGREQDQRFE